jgi:hypothetical protein
LFGLAGEPEVEGAKGSSRLEGEHSVVFVVFLLTMFVQWHSIFFPVLDGGPSVEQGVKAPSSVLFLAACSGHRQTSLNHTREHTASFG